MGYAAMKATLNIPSERITAEGAEAELLHVPSPAHHSGGPPGA
jgi:hypothetical protein